MDGLREQNFWESSGSHVQFALMTIPSSLARSLVAVGRPVGFWERDISRDSAVLPAWRDERTVLRIGDG